MSTDTELGGESCGKTRKTDFDAVRTSAAQWKPRLRLWLCTGWEGPGVHWCYLSQATLFRLFWVSFKGEILVYPTCLGWNTMGNTDRTRNRNPGKVLGKSPVQLPQAQAGVWAPRACSLILHPETEAREGFSMGKGRARLCPWAADWHKCRLWSTLKMLRAKHFKVNN